MSDLPPLTIITVNTAGKDEIRGDHVQAPGLRYVLLTDNLEAPRPANWDVRPVPLRFDRARDDAILLAMWCRYFPWEAVPDADDLVLWIDGRVHVNTDPRATRGPHEGLHGALGPTGDWLQFRHPERDCIYDESIAHRDLSMDHPEVISAHMGRYAEAGFPRHFGLHCSGWILRRRTAATEEMGRLWWHEVSTGSFRDQLSLDFVRWHMGDRISFRSMPPSDWNYWFALLDHAPGHHSVGLRHRLPVRPTFRGHPEVA